MDGNCEEVVQEIVAFVVIGILGAIMLALPIIIFCVMKRKKNHRKKIKRKTKMNLRLSQI